MMKKNKIIDYLSKDEVKLLEEITKRGHERKGQIALMRRGGVFMSETDFFFLDYEIKSQIKRDKKMLEDLKKKASIRRQILKESTFLKKT